MKHHPLTLIGLLALCLAVPTAFAAEPAAATDGIYRLSFYGAPGPGTSLAPLTVWLERQGGSFTQGFAVAETFSSDAQAVDFRGLKLEGDRLSGEVKVSWRPFHLTPWQQARAGKGAKATAPPVVRPPVVRTYLVDLVLKEHEVATEYKEGEVGKSGVAMVSAIRFDPPVMPERTAWEFAIRGCLDRALLKGGGEDTDVEIRVAMPAKEAWVHGSTNAKGDWPYVNPLLAHRPATVTEWQLTGDKLRVALKFLAKEGGTEYVVALEGRRLGWLVSGTATIAYNGQTRTAPFLGRVWTSPVSNLPVIPEGPPPAAPPAAEADPTLVAAAVAQANQPLFVAEPGGREFWHWRWLAIYGALSCIHPPFFEVKEMPGAVKYRIALTGQAPPKPLPILRIAPDHQYRPGKGVQAAMLTPDTPPKAWLASDTIPGVVEGDPLTDLGGAEACRPESGSAFKVQGREYRFSPLEPKGFTPNGSVDLAALGIKAETTIVLFAVWENADVRYVRWRPPSIGRAAVDVVLAGRKLDARQIVRLEKGMYPLLVIVRMRGADVRPMRAMLGAVGDEEVQSVEQELARPAPRLVTASFEAAKPWRPLTPIWKDLPYGGYTLSVTGLDADGKPLATPAEFHKWTPRTAEELPEAEKVKVDHGWFSKGRNVWGEYKAKSVWYVPAQPITLAKRRPFDGPYVAPVPPAEARARVLQAARWMRDGLGVAGYRGLLPCWESVGGSVESLFRGGGRAIGNALALQLADDPAERQATRLSLDVVGNLLLGDQEFGAGLNRLYANHTCMHIWDGGAYLDMFAATGADKYRQAALRTARECVYYQLPDGAFGGAGSGTLGNSARKSRVLVPPAFSGGYFWPDATSTEIRSFNPAAFLWFLGRLRHDLKTNDFLENEQRAMKYVRWNLANDFFWVEDGPHTPPLAYPCAVHSHIVQYLLLYLLEYAAPEDRDLKLIEQLALWCEDRNIIWDRDQGPTTGWSKDGGRSGGLPAETFARMAHVYARLWQATKNPLHRAKAESLLSVVLAAQDTRTGDIPMDLRRGEGGAPRLKPDHPAVRYGIMLRDLLAAAETMRTTK